MMKLVVLSCVLAAASATGLWGYGPLPYAYTAGLGLSNYRGPLSLAPGQPANVLGWDGRPLDTLDVNLDRSAHLVAKTLGGHLLKKRSVVTFTSHVAAPLITPSVPLTYGTAHLAPLTVPYAGFAPIHTSYGRIAAPLIW